MRAQVCTPAVLDCLVPSQYPAHPDASWCSTRRGSLVGSQLPVLSGGTPGFLEVSGRKAAGTQGFVGTPSQTHRCRLRLVTASLTLGHLQRRRVSRRAKSSIATVI